MKILVLSDNYEPEIAASSFRVRDHAKVWIEQGHDVTVVTCVPNWPYGKVFPGYKNRLYQEEWIDGVRVIRLWSYMTANAGFLKRSLDYFSYLCSVVAFFWRFPKFDVILATSPQFFTAVAGWMLSLLRRRPWVFELRDLWPESIKAVGAGQGLMISLLERLELFLYRRADRIVSLTESFTRNLVDRGIDAGKIDLVTNGVDTSRFNPQSAEEDVRAKLGISPDCFVTGYIGTTGMAHGLETVVEAAALCRHCSDIKFVIMGEGAERQSLEELARAKQLTNLRFVDRVTQDKLPSYIAAFDLPIIHLRPDPVFRTVIPSKLFEFMAMERPVLLAVEGEAATIVENAKCGVCVPSGDPKSMAAKVLKMSTDPARLLDVGQQGRRVVMDQYSRSSNALLALESLRLAINEGRPTFLITPYERTKLHHGRIEVQSGASEPAGSTPKAA